MKKREYSSEFEMNYFEFWLPFNLLVEAGDLDLADEFFKRHYGNLK